MRTDFIVLESYDQQNAVDSGPQSESLWDPVLTPLDAPYRSGSIPYCKGRRVLRVQRQLYQLHVPRIRFHVGTTDPCLESFGRGSKGGEGPLRLFDPFSRGTVTSWLDFGEVIEMCKSVRESGNSTHMFKRNYV